ncbi:MAG: Gfo/Idh/MocA family oxidoreductase [Candidatus Hydrogenedentes bacterium]|nr:Gfo/Idh/MocA family oxidoreductase [Candidatus Hydrogenedentota bacterium]
MDKSKNRDAQSSRREFLKKLGVLTGSPLVVSFSLFDKENKPSEKVGVGFIGTGERGRYLMKTLSDVKQAQLIAICDVRKKDLDEAFGIAQKMNEDVVLYKDFRELLARDDIDAVVIATPDHWHGPVAISAIRAGKDVYVEKPLTISLEDDLKLREEVKKHNRVFQFGTQQRSNEDFAFACELVRNGYIGELKKIRVGVPGGITGPICSEEPIPEGFDYDMWLGPAPYSPYCEARTVRPYWYHITDYAMGFIGGWGIHHVDIAQWGHGKDDALSPVEYYGKGVFPKEGICDGAISWDVEMRYTDGVVVHFTNEQTQAKEPNLNRSGVKFEGSDGWVFVNRETIEAEPKSLLSIKLKESDIRLYKSKHHMKNFIECVISREQPVAPIDVAVRSNVICLLSEIAIRTNKIIKWDPVNERILEPLEFPNEVYKLFRRPKRDKWNL